MTIPKHFSTVRLSNVGNSGLPLAFLKLYHYFVFGEFFSSRGIKFR